VFFHLAALDGIKIKNQTKFIFIGNFPPFTDNSQAFPNIRYPQAAIVCIFGSLNHTHNGKVISNTPYKCRRTCHSAGACFYSHVRSPCKIKRSWSSLLQYITICSWTWCVLWQPFCFCHSKKLPKGSPTQPSPVGRAFKNLIIKSLPFRGRLFI